MFVSLLIPCHNERDAIGPLMEELAHFPALLRPNHFVEVVFVDDGSTDGTPKILQAHAARAAFPMRILGLAENRGLGAALREGAALVAGEAVITYDADRPYPLEDALKLLHALDSGADIATASPWHPSGSAEGVPARRRVLSRGVSFLYRLRLGKRGRGLHTFTCGFRAYRTPVLQKNLPRRDGFVATAEILLNALKRGARVVEIPSRLRDRTEGESKMRTGRALRAHLSLLLRG